MGEQASSVIHNVNGRGRQQFLMDTEKISRTLLRRLPIYLELLKNLPGEDGNISATTIANNLGMGHVMVRKDLAKVSVEGRCRTGRSRKQLIRDIEDFLEHCAEMAEAAAMERERM